MFHHLSRDSHCSGACARATRMPTAPWRSQLARHTTVLHRKKEASRRAVPLQSAQADHNQRGTARARQARVLCHLPRDSHRSSARARAMRMPAARWALDVTAITSHRSLATKERDLLPVECSIIPHQPISTSADGARAASSRASPPPERQPPQWRSFACHENAGCALEIIARTSHHGLASNERGLSPVKCRSVARGSITVNATRLTRTASSRVLQPPERQPPQWRLRACHANADCTLEVTARTSHHGLVPKQRGLPPVQCLFLLHRKILTSAAKRRHDKLAWYATSRETAGAVTIVHVPRECQLRVGGHSSHVAPESCPERKRPPADAVLFCVV